MNAAAEYIFNVIWNLMWLCLKIKIIAWIYTVLFSARKALYIEHIHITVCLKSI